MKTVEMDITPQMAQKYLEKNPKNRTVSQRKVAEYANEMKAGRWDLTHQGIAFDAEGNLIDGQHRLLACIKSGKTLHTQVSFDCTVSANLDCGRNRSLRDRMYTSGKAEKGAIYRSNQILAAVRYGMTWPHRNSSFAVSPDMIEKAIDLYRDEWNEVNLIITNRKTTLRGGNGAPAALAVFWALCNGVDSLILGEWYQILQTGEYDCPKYRSPEAAKSILWLRNYYLRRGGSVNSGEANSLDTFKRCLSSIRYYVENATPSRLYGQVCFDNPYEDFNGEENNG